MDLEDHFYRLRDQHLQVKKEAQEAKNQVKILTARVARMLSDKKTRLRGQRTGREVELEELIFDMNSRVSELERENFRLKEKSLLLRSQLISSHPRHRDISSAYAHIPARVDSGLRRKAGSANSGLSRHKSFSTTSLHKGEEQVNQSWTTSTRPMTARGVRVKLGSRDQSSPRLEEPLHLHLLIEARDEIKNMEQIIQTQQRQLRQMLPSNDMPVSESMNQEKNSNRKEGINHQHHDRDHENGYNMNRDNDRQSLLRHSPGQAASENSPSSLSVIALKDRVSIPLKATLKSYRISGSESQHQNNDFTNEKVVAFVESLKADLKHEKEKNSHLEKQMLSCRISTRTLDELKQKIHELEQENQILQDSLRKCLSSCFSEMRGSSSSAGKRCSDSSLEAKRLEIMETLQKQIYRLQDKLKHVESENSSLQKQLLAEQETVFKLDEENVRLSTRLEELVIGNGEPSQQQAVIANGIECHRADHMSMESQLTHMHKERTELLRELSEMRQILETIQTNVHKEDDEQEVYEDDFEVSATSTASTRK